MGEMPVLTVNHAIEITHKQSMVMNIISNMVYAALFWHGLILRGWSEKGQCVTKLKQAN